MTTDAFSNNRAHAGAFIVYMNGLRVPCPRVNFSYGVWQMPEMTLSFAPHRLLERLGAEDKLSVVVFYLDDFYAPGDPRFCLCFEGEIIGWHYNMSSGSRAMQFDAVCDIQTYGQLYYFFMNNVDTIVDVATQRERDATGISQPGVFYPFSLFKKGLLSESDEPPADISGPYQLLENILRGMVGSNLPANRRAIPGINFFSRWVRKRNMINRFVALPFFEDETGGSGAAKGAFAVFKAVSDTYVLEATSTSLAQSVGDAGSLMDVIKTVFGTVYYELAMIPTPALVRTDLHTGAIIGSPDLDPVGPPAQQPLRLTNYFAKPQTIFAIPPSCNVFFTSMVRSFGYNEAYNVQPTRTYVNDAFYSGVAGMGGPFTGYALTVGYPPEVGAALKRKYPKAEKVDEQSAQPDPTTTGRNVLLWPEEYFKGPVVARSPIPKWYTMLLNGTKTDEERANVGDLFELYAQYEHNRARYEKRGGSVNLKFNPYVVPGFPCVIFDSDPVRTHVVGYVMSVTHSFSASGGMETSVTYGFGRTLREMLDEVMTESKRLGGIIGAAPADPIDATRENVQDFDVAENFYNALFHQRTPMKDSKKASFDFREIIGYAKDDGTAEPITLTGPDQAEIDLKFKVIAGGAEAIAKPADPHVYTNIDDTREFQPLPAFEGAFASYDTAMQYVSRPVVTLEQYIQFVHGDRPLQELIDAKIIVPEAPVFGATSYSQIRVYRPTTADTVPPTPAMVGAEEADAPPGTTTPIANAYTGAPEAVPADFPETRADWAKLIIAYRDEMAKIAPQR